MSQVCLYEKNGVCKSLALPHPRQQNNRPIPPFTGLTPGTEPVVRGGARPRPLFHHGTIRQFVKNWFWEILFMDVASDFEGHITESADTKLCSRKKYNYSQISGKEEKC